MSENARNVFQKNLKQIMRVRGITNADICRALDVSSGTVSSWVTGKKYPRVDVLRRLSDYLDVQISMLVAPWDENNLWSKNSIRLFMVCPYCGQAINTEYKKK